MSMLNKLPPGVCWGWGGGGGCEHAEQASSRGVLEGRGREATGLLNKGGGEQQASCFSN